MGVGVWLGTFGVLAGLDFHLSQRRHGSSGTVDWLFVGLLSSALAGLIVTVLRHIRSRPSPVEQAALAALLSAEPGTIGAVLVTRNGVPEVIATVRSREEYMELVHSGQLPAEHQLFMPSDA